MTRAGSTWKNYGALLSELAARAGETLEVVADPNPREEELLFAFQQELKGDSAEAQAVLERLGISPKQFTHHLRYMSRWNGARRRLLSEGGNFQLLQNQGKVEDRLEGLSFQGKKTRFEQQAAINEHLREREEPVEGQGWLPPLKGTGRTPKQYSAQQVVWIYDQRELEHSDDLHPAVARSLIAQYLPKPGLVADPMAGSGNVVREARRLGHRVWASDKYPQDPSFMQHDLFEHDLSEILGEEQNVGVDLLVVHPPTSQTLAEDLKRVENDYEGWLLEVLVNAWGALKGGGHLALIVEIGAGAADLLAGEWALLASARQMLRVDIPKPTAMRVAVARDGHQGWHILVLRKDVVK